MRAVPRLLVLLTTTVFLATCAQPPATNTCSGTVLFGRPNASTGLTDAQCQPTCTCGGKAWSPPNYSAADAKALLDWQPVDPPAELTTNPYDSPAPAAAPDGTVCGVLPVGSSKQYRLVTYASESAATAAGAKTTHFGACGLCSTLQDLSVYMTQNDLTAPVRQCGLDNLSSMSGGVACLQKLGFTLPCAEIWYFNTVNTRNVCSDICFSEIGASYNQPDGTLNACLQCDEDMSGAVFKAVAGRTRRNTGLPNSICRPCSEVKKLVHAY
jgi:hypothetical protein